MKRYYLVYELGSWQVIVFDTNNGWQQTYYGSSLEDAIVQASCSEHIRIELELNARPC